MVNNGNQNIYNIPPLFTKYCNGKHNEKNEASRLAPPAPATTPRADPFLSTVARWPLGHG